MAENSTSPTDAGFILMLCFAVLCDFADIFLNLFEYIASFGIPFISAIIDFFATIIVGTWLRSQGGNVPEKTNVKKPEKGEKTSKEETKNPTSKITKKFSLKRLIISYIIEQIPILGTISFTWTINVISTLRKK